MTAEIVKVPFYGSWIFTALIDGEPVVVLKPTIEVMGLNYTTQFDKLKTRSWATVVLRGMVAEDGKVRQMATIDLDGWAMFLANINENKVRPELKQTVIAYQKESAKALRRYWLEGGAINPAATVTQLQAKHAEIDELLIVRRQEQLDYRRVITLLARGGAMDRDYAFVQDNLYLDLFGCSARSIRRDRRQLQGDRYKRGPRKGELIPSKVAKDYLTEWELALLNKAVLMLTSMIELAFQHGRATLDDIKLAAKKVGEMAKTGRALSR